MDIINKNLSNQSKKLIKLINPIVKNIKFDNKISNNKLIKKIYKIMKKSYKNDIKYNIIKEVFNYELYKHLLKYNFIDNVIKKNIEKNIKTVLKITYNDINLNLFIRNKNINSNINKKIINILNIISIVKKLFKNTKEIQVNIILTKHKKVFPKKNETIGPINSNSGLTYYPDLNKNGVIIIFRDEEYCKVLFHECIHALYGDIKLWNFKNNEKIFKKFCLNLFEYNKININETYTEFLASIFNQIFILIKLNKKLNKINTLFKYESIYSLIKCKQILNHYNYKDIKKIYSSKKCKIFNQKTSILSYYIFKTSLYFNINNSLDFYLNNTKLFKIKEKDTELFLLLIDKSTDYLLLNILSNFDIKNFKSKTLRMTLLEL